ncbi:NUDIX domain-containing protein [Nocardioides panacihumi]|uniref:NUDIX domain-containing protein n=1 Tax=Nocardioides panacihumi TaxID=400774 RepID=A0ABP5C5I3_9ACTN
MTHDRFVVVPAAYLFLLRPGPAGDEVLLQRRGPGVPYMAGHFAAGAAGHVERGETAFDAVAREAAEELGIAPGPLSFLTTMQRTQGGEAIDERVDFFFTARSWTGEPRIKEPDKATDLGWFPLSTLPSPMVPHEELVLRALAAGPVPAYLAHGF